MMVRVLFFGPLARELGAREVSVEVGDQATGADVGSRLAAMFPDKGPFFRSARLSVNGVLGRPETPVREGDELAVIELVGGG